MNAPALDLDGSGGKIFAGRFDGKKIQTDEIHRFQNEPIEAAGRLYWEPARPVIHHRAGMRGNGTSG